MTTDSATPIITHTIVGTGPYAVPWPYQAGELVVSALRNGAQTILANPGQWSVAPAEASAAGTVTLAVGTAETFDGSLLLIERNTTLEQGWEGQSGREVGLMLNLDRLMRAVQDLKARQLGTLRQLGSTNLPPIPPLTNGAALVWLDGLFVSGPTAADITNAQWFAEQAQGSLQATQEIFADFDALYLGSKTDDPAVDNSGNPLLVGAIYFNTVSGSFRAWTGSSWLRAFLTEDGSPLASPNVASLAGLSLAEGKMLYATGPGTFAMFDSSEAGRALLGAANKAAMRTYLELGAAALLSTSVNADFSADTTSLANRATIKAFVDALQLTFRNANSLGWGTAIQDVTASRSAGTTYQNTSGRPRFWSIYGQGGSPRYMQTSVNGIAWTNAAGFGSNGEGQTSSVLLAPDLYYRAAPGLNVYGWWETF